MRGLTSCGSNIHLEYSACALCLSDVHKAVEGNESYREDSVVLPVQVEPLVPGLVRNLDRLVRGQTLAVRDVVQN